MNPTGSEVLVTGAGTGTGLEALHRSSDAAERTVNATTGG